MKCSKIPRTFFHGFKDMTTSENSAFAETTSYSYDVGIDKKLEETPPSVVKVQKLDENCRHQKSTISPDTEPSASPVRLVFQGKYVTSF